MFLEGISLRTLEADYLGFQPYEHQYQSEEIIKGENGFFCFNCSPTGSGKTLSWLKPALDMEMDVIAMYPTNALISDQVDNANHVIRDHFAGMGHEVIRITSSSIYKRRQEQYAGEANVSNGTIIAHLIERSLDKRGSSIVMTNPDIFTLIMKDMYRDRYLSSLINRFEMIVVDEFHLADIKQRNSILFLLHCIHDLPPSISKTNKFYFLSATPDDAVVKRIREAIGVDPVVIESSGIAIGRNERVKAGYRAVMPPVDLDVQSGRIFSTFEILCGEHLEDITGFCEGGKTVIMLDGIHEVDVLYNELVDNVSGMCVERIDGFHRGDLAEKLKRFDVLVSNSSVEVGIDFDVDQITFTGYNKSSLIQRLGRLRNRDNECNAICYTPRRIADHLNGISQKLNRDQFKLELENIFGDVSDPISFTWRYSPIEAYDYAKAVADRLPSDRRSEYAKSTIEQINKHYYHPFGMELGGNDINRMQQWIKRDVIEELRSYRGSGIQLMIYDKIEGEIKLYTMFYLLRWGKVEFMDKARFLKTIPEEYGHFVAKYESFVSGFCVYYGKNDEPRSIYLKADSLALFAIVNTPESARMPEVLSGFTVHASKGSKGHSISQLNETLSEKRMLCMIVDGNPYEKKILYNLGDFFFLYPLYASGKEYSVVFGNDALYMDCFLKDRRDHEREQFGWG